MSERGGGRERREVGNKPDAEERDKEKRGGEETPNAEKTLTFGPRATYL